MCKTADKNKANSFLRIKNPKPSKQSVKPRPHVGNVKWAASRENLLFVYTKTKAQLSCVETAQLISDFVFTTQIVQSIYFLNPKFQASSYLFRLYSPVCVGGLGRKLRNRF